MKPEFQSRYADLLTEPSDEALGKLIQELDAEYTAPVRPADLSWVVARQSLTQVSQPASKENPSLLPVQPLRLHTMRSRKIALLAVAAFAMVAMLSVALLNVKAPFHFQQSQSAFFVGADGQLLQQLVQDKGTPTDIQQLLQNGQFTAVNLTSSTYNVHIQDVYADANNVVLLYTVDRDAWFAAASSPFGYTRSDGGPISPLETSEPVLTLETSSGQVLPHRTERVDFGKGSASENKQIAILAYYDVSAIQGNPTQLTLTAALSKKISSSQEKIGEFTTPVHTEKKVVNVNQTASSNGQAFTLERVVITPTEARFYYSLPSLVPPTTRDTLLIGSLALSIEGKPYAPEPFPDDSNNGVGDTYGWFALGTHQYDYMSIYDALLGQTGTWVYTAGGTKTEGANSSGFPTFTRYDWKLTFTVS
jgi:hypothetical protein